MKSKVRLVATDAGTIVVDDGKQSGIVCAVPGVEINERLAKRLGLTQEKLDAFTVSKPQPVLSEPASEPVEQRTTRVIKNTIKR